VISHGKKREEEGVKKRDLRRLGRLKEKGNTKNPDMEKVHVD